mgnify:CR=1 FL=1
MMYAFTMHGVTITFINRQFIHDCLMKMSTGWPQKYCGHTLVLGHDVMPNNHFGHDVSGGNPGLVAPYPPSYPPGHYNLHTNGHLVINITQPNHSFMISDGATPGHVSSSSSSSSLSLGPVSMPSVLPLPHFVESPKANTIINDVNVRKDTLRVEKDRENPGSYLVSFSFDATTDGW